MRAAVLVFAFALVAPLAARGAPQGARQAVAVPELENHSKKITSAGALLLTDAVRKAAIEGLQEDAAGFREGLDLLQMPADLQCSSGPCLAKIGRRLHAKYVVGGLLEDADGRIAISLEAWETASGERVGSEAGSAVDYNDAMTRIHELALRLMRHVASAKSRQFPSSADVSFLDVLFKPDGSEVTLDGDEIGFTPIWNVKVKPGRHQIVIEKEDYFDEKRTLDIQGDLLLEGSLREDPTAPERHKRVGTIDWVRFTVLVGTSGSIGMKMSLFGLAWGHFYLTFIEGGASVGVPVMQNWQWDTSMVFPALDTFAGSELGYVVQDGRHYFAIGTLLGWGYGFLRVPAAANPNAPEYATMGLAVRPSIHYRYYWGKWFGFEVSLELPMVFGVPTDAGDNWVIFPPQIGFGIGM